MLKQTITYTDFNGNERTEDFYFNFTKIELLEMEANSGSDRSYSDMLLSLIEEKDMMKIALTMKTLLLAAYGEKSEDGKRFVKTQELREAFESSPAFDELYFEIATNADKAAEFVNGVIPKNLLNQMDSEPAELAKKKLAEISGDSE